MKAVIDSDGSDAVKTAMAVMEETEDDRRKGVLCSGTEESIL